jgi:WD40 repeat protein
MTFLLYLNDDYEGGETKFYKNKNDEIPLFTYKAEKGDLLIFDHDIWHEGSAIISGEKYILRSDLIFKIEEKRTSVNHCHKGYIWNILDYQGAIYSAGRDKKIMKWNYDLGYLAENEVHDSSVLALEGVAGHIYSVSRDGSFAKLTADLKLIHKVDSRHISPLSISVTKQELITTGSDGYIRIWDFYLNLKNEIHAHKGWSWRCVSKDDATLISIGSDGIFNVFNSHNHKCVHSVDLLHGSLRCCVVSGELAYIGCENGKIITVCLKDFTVKNIYNVHDGIVRDVTVKGLYVYSCGEDGRIVKTNIIQNSQKTIVKYEDFVSSISFVKNSRGYSSGYDGVITCY